MQTKIIGGGVVNPGVELGIDPTFLAARVSLRPYDYAQFGQVLGHYRSAGTTAAITPSSNAVLFNMRWADPSRFFVLQRFSAFVTLTTVNATPQRQDPLSMQVVRNYTASETTNATSILPTGNGGKARVTMGTTLVTQMSVASAAAGISGGTRTADTTMASLPINLSTVNLGAATLMDDFVRADQLGMHPLVLSANEGFIVLYGTTALTTAAVEISFICSWAEVVVF